jgi:hypothetical protein
MRELAKGEVQRTVVPPLERLHSVAGHRPRRPLTWRTPLRPAVRALRSLSLAAQGVRRYGGPVRATYGITYLRQLIALWRLNLKNGYTADDFYRYRLYGVTPARSAQFVTLWSNIAIRTELYRRLGLDVDQLADKRRFGRACSANGLPVAATVEDVADGQVTWWSASRFPPADLFVKEAASMCGAGAASWTYSDGRWSSGGITLDASGLCARLMALSREAPLLIQWRLCNHPDLAAFGPSGLCTVRVVTERSPLAPDARVLLAAFRMPTGGDVADNFARGGLACAVDLVDGVIGVAVRKDLAAAQHPDSGATIPGTHIPFWPEVRELALRAHRVFGEFPSVGWDIAVAPTGPVLLEANYNWDVVLAQQAGCRPLGASGWVDHMLQWLRWSESEAARTSLTA